ncbi:MAG: hypothetical protein WC310_03575 [Patescibacteria group bacterium]|jgi:hypothetical protein
MKGIKQKKALKVASLIFALAIFCLLPKVILAQQQPISADSLGLNVIAENTVLPTTDIRLIVARIIQVSLGLVGLVSVAMLIYAGFIWMTSGGEEEKINQAKATMRNWAIGLAVILLAFAIVSFVINGLTNSAKNYQFGSPSVPFTYGRGALGNGIIESHYPPRGAHCTQQPPSIEGCIPRNTMIIVTFKERMDLSTFIKGNPNKNKVTGVADNDCPNLDAESCIKQNNGQTGADYKEWWEYLLDYNAVKIYLPSSIEANKNKELPLGPENALGIGDNADKNVYFRPSSDSKTVLFVPTEPLGTANDRYYYSVNLSNSISKANGERAFSASGADSYYEWSFEVGPFLDITAPKIESVYPTPNKTEARNVVIQMNFNEAVNPLTVSGLAKVENNQLTTESFRDIVVSRVVRDNSGNITSTVPLGGTYTLSNQYRTVEFTTEPEGLCGTNSCGDDVYCLPQDSEIEVNIKSATLSPNPPTAAYDGSYDGVTDLAANSFNGNGLEGGVCEIKSCVFVAPKVNGCDCTIGPVEDNYFWYFKTNNKIILDPPYITNIDPGILFSDVAPDKRVSVVFQRLLMGRSLNSSNIAIATNNKVTFNGSILNENLPFWVGFSNLDNASDSDSVPDNQSQVLIDHDDFLESKIGESRYDYSLHLSAGIKDIYQNCYYPAGASTEVSGGCNYPYQSADKNTPSCCNDILYNTADGESDECPKPLWIEWPASASATP